MTIKITDFTPLIDIGPMLLLLELNKLFVSDILSWLFSEQSIMQFIRVAAVNFSDRNTTSTAHDFLSFYFCKFFICPFFFRNYATIKTVADMKAECKIN